MAGTFLSSGEKTDAAIVALWKAGDRKRAIGALAMREGMTIYRVCFKALGDASLAEDTMQRVFIDAQNSFETCEVRTNLRQWLIGIACHRCLDLARKQSLERERFLTEEAGAGVAELAPGPDEQIDNKRRLKELADCITRLPLRLRVTLGLKLSSGLSYAELARASGDEAATLQARVARALPQLRACLKRKGVAP